MADAHYDALETRDPAVREAAQMAALPQAVARAKATAPGWAARLADVDAAAVTSRAALAALPVTRKSELGDLQRQRPPFGGLATDDGRDAARLFASPGPIYEPEGRDADYWRLARALFAAGFRPGDRVHNCFSYHLTPAGSMLETGALALGCSVCPGGTGQTELQVQALAGLGADGYVGTPSFLKIILDKADELGVALPRLTKALVSGEAFPRSLADALAARGIAGYQVYASADLGSIAYETVAREGLVVDEGVLVEILRPGTGDPVAAGEVGEVVVTALTNRQYPLIRFATGDLSAFMPGLSACGRTNARIRGWMGRADQTTKVKGMFVHPSQVAAVLRRHPEVVRARLVVDNPEDSDRMTLVCEATGTSPALAEALVASLRDLTKLRADVRFCAPGSLPNDGKVIEDARVYR
ncbi:MAG: AMP-binding protein [Proteobacteria bacterium]|nr:AMP-binding protein [Pseudomonadota bacterium]